MIGVGHRAAVRWGSCGSGGYIDIADRATGMVIAGGTNAYSKEVENALDALEGVTLLSWPGI